MGAACSANRKKVGDSNNNSVQDEARSFRSKVDAIKFIMRNVHSRYALRIYLEGVGGVEYLMCYTDLEEIKMQKDADIAIICQSTLSKYEAMNENSLNFEGGATNDIEQILWEKLRRLRALDLKTVTRKELTSTINAVQSNLLGELADPFEGFLKSPQYKQWNEHQVSQEKNNHLHMTDTGGSRPIGAQGSGKKPQGRSGQVTTSTNKNIASDMTGVVVA